MASLISLGLPLDYYKTLPARAAKVTKEDVARVAQKWVKAEQWPIVIVGPVGPAKADLDKLGYGPVTIQP